MEPSTPLPVTGTQPDFSGLQHSATIAKIAEALASAQGEMSGAKKDAANPFFHSRYADLAAVIGAIRGPMSRAKIAYVQSPGADEKGEFLDTMLVHSSGEWIKGRIRMKPVKNDPQGIGSLVSYMRRYSLQAVVGLEAADDDANTASDPAQQKPKADKRTPLPDAAVEAKIPVAGSWKHFVFYLEGPNQNKELGQLTDEELGVLYEKYCWEKKPTTAKGKELQAALLKWREETDNVPV